MPLTKWVSNNVIVISMFQDKVDQVLREEGTTMLGLQRCNSSNEFSFEGLELNPQTELTYID